MDKWARATNVLRQVVEEVGLSAYLEVAITAYTRDPTFEITVYGGDFDLEAMKKLVTIAESNGLEFAIDRNGNPELRFSHD